MTRMDEIKFLIVMTVIILVGSGIDSIVDVALKSIGM